MTPAMIRDSPRGASYSAQTQPAAKPYHRIWPEK